jgi:multidrug efflux pump subunit AcrA (membrane-fusion protein)
MARGWNLLALGLALAAAGCGEAASEKAAEVRPVRALVVDPKPLGDARSAIGEVKPRYESDLGFRIAGKITQRTVDIGSMVKKGDVLAHLDDQDYRNKAASAETDIVAAQAVLTEAQAAEGRLRHLLANGNTTRANYDVALKNLRSAEAKLESAKTSLKLANDQVAYCTLRADFDGIVTATGAEPVTRTFQVKVTLKDPPEQMRFGGSVVGRVKASTTPVVVLPGSALFDKAGQPAVWIVDPASGSVLLKPVTVTRYETDRVVIGAGLAKGDIVVTACVNRLRENQKVRVAEGGAP